MGGCQNGSKTQQKRDSRDHPEDVKEELTDEEVLRLIIEKKVTKKTGGKEKYTFGQRAADTMARFAGSWKFVLGFLGFLVVWVIINHAFGTIALDPFPFILLNLLLSCVAAIQAPDHDEPEPPGGKGQGTGRQRL